MKKTIIVIALLLASAAMRAEVKLPAFFSDNMVLQQNSTVKMWGTAKAGKKVTLTTSWDGASYMTTAAADGNWNITFDTPSYGGPYTVTVADSRKPLVLSNVLIGDIWVCGGQSNMEMQINSDVTGMAETKASASNYPNIRLLHVENTTAGKPVNTVEIRHGGWKMCDAETIGDFSAAGYYFGRYLNENLDIPIGLLESCWGGTLAEAWTSAESLGLMPEFRDQIAFAQSLPASKEGRLEIFHRQVDEWRHKIASIDHAYTDGKLLWGSLEYDASSWSDQPVPGFFQENGFAGFSGLFWVRKTIEIPASWAGSELTLSFAMVDDNDFTYFNGVEVGHTEGCWLRREYKIPASLVKAGKAVVSVRIYDGGGLGGVCGDPDLMYIAKSDTEKISLAGIWKGRPSLAMSEIDMFPSNTVNEPNVATFLYNAMINPIKDIPVKGAIWYQGESNAPRAEQYQTLFPLMIQDWRKAWGINLPFYFCQLANYQTVQTGPEESDWAELREAQLMTTSLENTGMAVLIDIGEAADIHPKNKVEVGRRLALNALALTYGKDVTYSGPVYDSYRIEGDSCRIFFKHVDGGLKTPDGSALSGFYICGPDRKFVKANAVIDGDTVVVSAPGIAFPSSVRYGWANNPVCNLYNVAGLPASPFRTDSWSRK